MKTAFIHVGLHKTGTTSVQNTLQGCRRELAAEGLLYPASCIPPGYGGHHNLAWELSRDRRHAPEHGNLQRLLAELTDIQSDIIVSSEDFESLIREKERWRPLVEGLRHLGFAIELIVYLRDPVRHLQSLYAELVRDGLGDEFQKVAATALAAGRLLRRDQVFMLDQNRVVSQLGAIAGTTLTIRNFEALVDGDVLVDFAVATRMSDAARQAVIGAGERSNIGISPAQQLQHFLAGSESGLRVEPARAAKLVTMLLGNEALVLDMPDGLKQALRHRHLLPHFPAVAASRPRDARALNIVRVFSFESRMMFRRMLMIGSTSSTDAEKRMAWDATRSAWWKFASVMD